MISKSLRRLIIIFSFAVAIVLINSGCSKKSEDKETGKSLAVLDTVAVKVHKAALQNLIVKKTFTGTLEGEEQANIVSKIPERITSIKVKVGDYVKTGQLLIMLDKTGASSQFYQAQAGYLNAEKEMKRMKALYEEGAISQQMFDGTNTAYEIAKANFEAAKNTVELTSPIDGVVTSISPNIGDIANPGIHLITVASIDKMKVLFDVGEEDIANIFIGQNSEIYSELKKDLIQKGKISQISKSADIQSRSFEVRALFSNTSGRWFKPGMFCRVTVELNNKKDIIAVPNAAITTIQNEKNIFIVNGNKASVRKIKTGITDGNFTEIISGLNAGESVVTVGINNLIDGNVVHVSE